MENIERIALNKEKFKDMEKNYNEMFKALMSDMRTEAHAYNKNFSNRFLKSRNYHQLRSYVHPMSRETYDEKLRLTKKQFEAEEKEKVRKKISDLN